MADEQTQDTQNLDANQASQDSGEDLAARVQVLEEQLAGAQDQALRVAADLQNVRRRAEQDVEKAHKFAWSVSPATCCRSSTAWSVAWSCPTRMTKTSVRCVKASS